MVWSTGAPDGTISQISRGASSRLARSARSFAPSAPAPASSLTASALRSQATTSCPSRRRRRVMLPPILPRPTIASLISLLSLLSS